MGQPTDEYRVFPDRVASVIDAVEGASDSLQSTYDDMVDSVGSASGAAGSSGIVTAALDEVVTWLADRQELMASVVELGVAEVSAAVDAYGRGDRQMAATIVSRMTAVLEDGH
jgi:hypothetical protein